MDKHNKGPSTSAVTISNFGNEFESIHKALREVEENLVGGRRDNALKGFASAVRKIETLAALACK